MTDPFAPSPAERDPIRRFRGRLAVPVTVWTASGDREPAGLTVSSILVAEGEQGEVAGLLGDLSEVWDAIHHTGRFVVHVLEHHQQPLAERFAGRLPVPGGLFAGVTTAPSDYGPVLVQVPTRAFCRLLGSGPVGYSQLVRGAIEDVETGDGGDALVYLRGRYRTLAQDRRRYGP